MALWWRKTTEEIIAAAVDTGRVFLLAACERLWRPSSRSSMQRHSSSLSLREKRGDISLFLGIGSKLATVVAGKTSVK